MIQASPVQKISEAFPFVRVAQKIPPGVGGIQLRELITRQRPVPAASEQGQVPTSRSIPAGLMAPLKKRPCAVSKPALRTNPSISLLSTPAAHTTSSKVCARLAIA